MASREPPRWWLRRMDESGASQEHLLKRYTCFYVSGIQCFRVFYHGALFALKVIMGGRHEGLLKVVQTIPALNNLSYCQLHRLCMSSAGTYNDNYNYFTPCYILIMVAELTYSKGEVILNGFETSQDECTWAIGWQCYLI